MQVEHWDTKQHGELTEQAMRNKLEQRGYHVNRYTYPPGTYFPDHAHEVDKIDAVLSVRFQMTLEGRTVILENGDCLAVPKGMVHSAKVIGNEPVVSLDAIRR